MTDKKDEKEPKIRKTRQEDIGELIALEDICFDVYHDRPQTGQFTPQSGGLVKSRGRRIAESASGKQKRGRTF